MRNEPQTPSTPMTASKVPVVPSQNTTSTLPPIMSIDVSFCQLAACPEAAASSERTRTPSGGQRYYYSPPALAFNFHRHAGGKAIRRSDERLSIFMGVIVCHAKAGRCFQKFEFWTEE